MDGHLDPSGTKVLRYIAWNDDHAFLDDKCLEPNEGVTFDLITPKAQQNNQENQQEKPEEQKGVIKKEDMEKKLEDSIKSLFKPVLYDNRKNEYTHNPHLNKNNEKIIKIKKRNIKSRSSN